VKQTETQY